MWRSRARGGSPTPRAGRSTGPQGDAERHEAGEFHEREDLLALRELAHRGSSAASGFPDTVDYLRHPLVAALDG